MNADEVRNQPHEQATEARTDSATMPGEEPVAVAPGGTTASSMNGSGGGGDIGHPDITGRGTSRDAGAEPDHGIAKGPGGGNLGPAAATKER